MNKKISFESNGFLFEAVSFDTKRMVLKANKKDKETNKIIKTVELRMAELPKSIKKVINPLKK